jgi:hypothetical protein
VWLHLLACIITFQDAILSIRGELRIFHQNRKPPLHVLQHESPNKKLPSNQILQKVIETS